MTNATIQSMEEEASENNMQQAIWHIDLEDAMVTNALKSEPKINLSKNASQRKRRKDEDAERHRLEKKETELNFL